MSKPIKSIVMRVTPEEAEAIFEEREFKKYWAERKASDAKNRQRTDAFLAEVARKEAAAKRELDDKQAAFDSVDAVARELGFDYMAKGGSK